MKTSKRILVSLLIAIAAAGALMLTAGASGGEGSKVLNASLAPSVPTDPAFHGVTPGGAPWVLDRGDVSIKSDGSFRLDVRGLVIPTLGNPDGVTTVFASLYCGADSSAAPAASTKSVPLSTRGDATIKDTIALPATCLAPIVLLHPNNVVARYISVTGWRS